MARRKRGVRQDREIDVYWGVPSPQQERFLNATAKNVLYGGARGGGKSWAVRVKAILLAYAWPGIRQIIIRKTYPELQANHIKPMREMLPKGSYRYNDTKKEITFGNGSQILFRYLSTEKDLDRFQGQECDVLYIDEATQHTEDAFKMLIACVRAVNQMPKRVYITCNPGGIGHQWVKRLFVKRQFQQNEDQSNHHY